MAGKRESARVFKNNEEEDDDSKFEDDQCKKIKLLHEIQDPKPSKDGIFEEETDVQQQENDDEDEQELVKPIGDAVRVSEEGGKKVKHFEAFKNFAFHFQLEDLVLVTPEEPVVKPSVAIIKDIFQIEDGDLTVSVQRFYRPEQAEKKEGGTWQTSDPRELFFSHFMDEIDAECIMHKCLVHMVPRGKPVPDRKVLPGFVVQKVYDYEHKTLRNITETDCKDVVKRHQAAS